MSKREHIDPETLWRAADSLRGQVDAAEYKHVVLGLLFLKYISDSFEARREQLQAELAAEGITGAQAEALLENRDDTPPSGCSGCPGTRAGQRCRPARPGPISPR